MKKYIPVIATVLLAGCASASYTKTTNGQASVDCSGVLRDWRTCEKQAAQICPDSGYNIISTSNETKSADGSWTQRLMKIGEMKAPRSMVVACRSGHAE